MKTCVRCATPKHDEDFYAKDRTCKECRKALIRANLEANADYYREYDRQRANQPDRVDARKQYQKTEAGRMAGNQAKRAYTYRNADRRKAHVEFRNAVRDGKVWVAPCCMNYGCMSTERVQGHHTDYDYPLGVVWLFDPCHKAAHKEQRARERQA